MLLFSPLLPILLSSTLIHLFIFLAINPVWLTVYLFLCQCSLYRLLANKTPQNLLAQDKDFEFINSHGVETSVFQEGLCWVILAVGLSCNCSRWVDAAGRAGMHLGIDQVSLFFPCCLMASSHELSARLVWVSSQHGCLRAVWSFPVC